MDQVKSSLLLVQTSKSTTKDLLKKWQQHLVTLPIEPGLYQLLEEKIKQTYIELINFNQSIYALIEDKEIYLGESLLACPIKSWKLIENSKIELTFK